MDAVKDKEGRNTGLDKEEGEGEGEGQGGGGGRRGREARLITREEEKERMPINYPPPAPFFSPPRIKVAAELPPPFLSVCLLEEVACHENIAFSGSYYLILIIS